MIKQREAYEMICERFPQNIVNYIGERERFYLYKIVSKNETEKSQSFDSSYVVTKDDGKIMLYNPYMLTEKDIKDGEKNREANADRFRQMFTRNKK